MPNLLHNCIHTVQHPLAPLITSQPLQPLLLLLALGLLLVEALLDSLAQSKDVAQHLRADTGLGAQRRDGHEARQHPSDIGQAAAVDALGVAQERCVVGAQDVDGQVRVALGEPVDEFGLEGVVDGGPEAQARLVAPFEVVGRHDPGGFRLEAGLDVCREGVAERAEGVDGAGDAVEGDAL